MEYIKTDTSPVYHTPLNPQRFGYDKLKYFAPYRSKHGIDFYFEIEAYMLQPRNEIFPHNHLLFKQGSENYLVIKLGQKYKLPQTCKTADGSMGTFRYTNLYNLKNPVGNRIKMI